MLKEKIKGALYGIAVADALGACCEGMRPIDIKGIYGTVKDMTGAGNWSPGEFTDDTWLTLAACHAYDDNSFNPQKAGDAMVVWMRTNGKGCGLLTNVALAHLSSGRADIYTAGKKAIGRESGDGTEKRGVINRRPASGAGNGSLMRCIATGLVHTLDQMDDIIKESTIISEITHADPKCVAACVGYNLVVAGLLEGKGFRELYSGAYQCTKSINREASKIFDFKKGGSPYGYDPSDMKHMGYVLRALDRALVELRDSDNFEDSIIKIVNEGGDADTNAAIAGGLLGAKLGFDAIPKRWVDELFDDEIEELNDAIDVLMKYRENNV